MKKEAALFIIKPDSMKSGKYVPIMAQLKKAGIAIVREAHRFRLKGEEVMSLYQEHKGKPFFSQLFSFMLSGATVLLVVTGEDAIDRVRKLLGHTDPKKAEPGTIRNLFGNHADMTANAAHCSGCIKDAQREIGIFFPELAQQLKKEGYFS
jgi:nucleoside-diphosphate kinase